jgi:ATP-dependent helicase/nuclease subunit A
MSGDASPTPRLTEEQRQALIFRGSSVALGAGAGCGKTTVLTERFLGEIEGNGGRALRALVALTFTEKASRELRQRIRARCRERLAGGAGADRWRTVLRALEAAPIGTFHEFCGRILRAHAVELGIDPDFAVFDEAIAASLRDQAVRTTVRRMLAEREPDLISLGLDYGLRQIREALSTLVGNRTAADLDAWVELSAAELIDRWNKAWQEEGRPAVLRGLSPLVRRCRDLLSELDAVHPKLLERRDSLLQLLPELEACACGDDVLGLVRELARVSDLGAKGIWPSPEAKEKFRNFFEILRKRIDDACKKMLVSESMTLQSAENSLRLARLASRARREYSAIKASRRGLDFDDLLVKARELLVVMTSDRNRPAVKREPIDFVLVDEFQDTDRIQSEILRLLGGEALFLGSMFVVGDAKQSIYRFRGAEPAILGQWSTEFAAEGRLRLTENFRSVPGVIHFVNALFAESFAEVDPDGDAANGPSHRLVPVRADVSDGPAVTFLWALPPTPEDAVPEGKTKASAEERRTNEARCLAGLLRDRLEAGWTIFDRDTRETRRAHAGDVAFLFRAMTEVWPYEAALAEMGFDYHTLGGSAFYAQQEVRDVVNVLSVVDDPLDEVSLAGVLRSPFFGLSDDGLFWLSRKFRGGLVEGVERVGEVVELNDRDRRAAERASELLTRWRGTKDRLPLGALVERVLDESGFEAALVCEFLGSRKLANTRKLVRLAGDFDRQENFSLGDFVARLRADLDDPPREEQAATTEEDSPTIRLMSIHQAKGLEFPIVVLPDLNRKPNQRAPFLGMSADLGLVVRPPKVISPAGDDGAGPEPGECLGWLAFQALEDDGDRRESLRLFYVAATRARDHLVLSAGLESAGPGDEGDGPKAASPAFQLLIDRFDWRTGRCLGDLPAGWPKPRLEVLWMFPRDPEVGRAGPSQARRLPEIERIITRAEVLAPPPDPRPAPLPGLIDLDPARELSGLAARRDRLIRDVLADKGLFAGDPLEEVCARAGARQVPAASSALVAEAESWLGPWVATPLYRELRDASRSRGRLEAMFEWTLAWPFDLDEVPRTVLQGSCEAVYRDRQGRWRPVIVSTGPCDELSERLRLMLSGVAAARRGRGESGPGWWVRKGPDGYLVADVDVHFHLTTVGQVLEAWWRSSSTRA